jgi:hypothetical protein
MSELGGSRENDKNININKHKLENLTVETESTFVQFRENRLRIADDPEDEFIQEESRVSIASERSHASVK